MNSVREHVRAVIGPPKASGISDKEIDDVSWEYYFDLDQTMDHILGTFISCLLFYLTLSHPEMQGKRNAAKERIG
jgi:elongation factor 1 alpha-like protein